ncbi:MAG: CRISPR-associated helicase Cas3' [Candidatus Aureabacteria bacterium]|nr:CRISPR-associated helicase Cas3' [Candidatus Auribacterota bacterium]
MEYYAHSENDQGKRHLLSDHLNKTAKLAESFCLNKDWSKFFYWAGMFHDLGKYQTDFQTYLVNSGERGSVPHASWGAGYSRILKQNEISFAIDGHHKGIPDRSHWKGDVDPYIHNDVINFDQVVQTYLKDNHISESDFKISNIKFSDPMHRECFVRYLFSSLTDADWLDTEAHFEPDKATTRESKFWPLDEMIRRLKDLIDSKEKTGEINQLRNQVLTEVLKKSGLPCGFYSLNVPTGLGKTLSSVSWAMRHAKENKMKRLILILPYINIIDQTARILKNIFGDEWVLEHHSNYNENDKDDKENIDPIQKRKLLATENWDYPIIVTTTVQFFESLFSNKPSKCRKIHNISESVIIFDEVQSIPKDVILPVLTLLKNIQSVMNSSFLFCTATLPAFEKRADFEGIENITPLVEDSKLLFDKTKRVSYFFKNDLVPVSMTDLWAEAVQQKDSVLVIFNTKKSARECYQVAGINIKEFEKIYHLSTSMCPVHRWAVIDSIRKDLADRIKIFVSSTQLIEAGVDFDFPCVMRAMAPLESIIQSAGRCNREGKMNRLGNVMLFKLEGEKMPDKNYGAYAQEAENLIKADINRLHEHDFFKEYYKRIIKLYADPDKKKINQARLEFMFETVNDAFRIIDQATESIFVWNYNDDSRTLYESIRYKPYLSKEDFRKMQVFSVPVYRNFLLKHRVWLEEKKIEDKTQGYWLWNGKYDETGIVVDPLTVEEMIV